MLQSIFPHKGDVWLFINATQGEQTQKEMKKCLGLITFDGKRLNTLFQIWVLRHPFEVSSTKKDIILFLLKEFVTGSPSTKFQALLDKSVRPKPLIPIQLPAEIPPRKAAYN